MKRSEEKGKHVGWTALKGGKLMWGGQPGGLDSPAKYFACSPASQAQGE